MQNTLGNITGTVSVALGAGEQIAVASFEVPVSTTLDADGGVVLHGAPHGALRQAVADALTEAATNLLASLPTAHLETVDEDR